MNQVLEQALATKKIIKDIGKVVEIHSETSKEQCEFLQRIIEKNKFQNSLEVGFAFGTSTAAICESISKFNGRHIVFDPEETNPKYWDSMGIELVNRCGYSHVLDYREKESVIGFSELLAEGKKSYFDFAYVDTSKLFDWITVDFYFIAKLLRIGGVVVFDDAMFPGIRKVMRFISQLPHFKVYDTYPANEPEPRGKLQNLLNKWSRTSYLIKEEYKKTDAELGINARCVAFQKTEEDPRNWDWHQPF